MGLVDASSQVDADPTLQRHPHTLLDVTDVALMLELKAVLAVLLDGETGIPFADPRDACVGA